jgi:DUF4097 and DUF4098 domain-containing protein YvlB
LQAATEENIQREFAAKSGGVLVVEVDFGAIDVQITNSERVAVDIRRAVTRKTKSEEEAFLKNRPVDFDQQGNTLKISSKPVRKERSSNYRGIVRNEGKYSIHVPPRFTVELRTAGGSVSVNGLEGEVKAMTSGGALRFTSVNGPVRGDTSGGGVEARNCKGLMDIRTSGGAIEVKNGTGRLDAKTSGGKIDIATFDGPVSVLTSGGSIRIAGVSGKI